jgi:hypothetical protein
MHTLRAWFEQDPRPMSRYRFAKEVGVTASYVTRLCKDDPPWPSRELAKRIGEVTRGYVTPNDLAGYGNGERAAYQPPYRGGAPFRGQAIDFDL